jgi:hypothetical protein
MTKEMRPSHRIDVLSDAILHYGRNCKDKLGSRSWEYTVIILPCKYAKLTTLLWEINDTLNTI